jgi:hypothetical protein
MLEYVTCMFSLARAEDGGAGSMAAPPLAAPLGGKESGPPDRLAGDLVRCFRGILMDT